MGKYDLPAAFKYIHSVTNRKIYYMGHSQGTMEMFVHLSSFKSSPVIEHLKTYIAVGPVATINHIHEHFLTWLASTNV